MCVENMLLVQFCHVYFKSTIISTSYPSGSLGCWSQFQLFSGKSRDRPWAVRQSFESTFHREYKWSNIIGTEVRILG